MQLGDRVRNVTPCFATTTTTTDGKKYVTVLNGSGTSDCETYYENDYKIINVVKIDLAPLHAITNNRLTDEQLKEVIDYIMRAIE